MPNKVEEVTSKAVGTVKAAKATLEGVEGVFRHLMREHGEVAALLERLKMSSDPDKREELWGEIRVELLSHEQGERLTVYPVFEQEQDTRAMAVEHERDAQGLEAAISELDAIPSDSKEWQPALERLVQLVQEHVTDEEEEYFPIADRVFNDRSADMLVRFESAKADAKRKLSASG